MVRVVSGLSPIASRALDHGRLGNARQARPFDASM